MMRKLLILTLLFPLTLFSQEYMESGWSFNYFAEFYNHPGIKIAYEKPISQKIKTKVKHDNAIYTHKQIIGKLSSIYYYHKNNHHGISILPELAFKKINHKGFFRTWSYGLGLHQSILPGPIFKQNADGRFSEHIAGQTTAIATLDFTVGRDLRFYKGKDYGWHMGIGSYLRFPFNGLFTPGTFIHAGFTIYPTRTSSK